MLLAATPIPHALKFLFSAVCESLCLNGGICSTPGNCTCPARWTGSACNEGITMQLL